MGLCDHLIGAGTEQYLLGDLRREAFEDMWDGSVYQALRQRHVRWQEGLGERFEECNWCYRNRYIDFEEMTMPEYGRFTVSCSLTPGDFTDPAGAASGIIKSLASDPRSGVITIQPHVMTVRKRRPAATNTSALDRWHIGLPRRIESRDGVVAFTASEFRDAGADAASAVTFHEALRTSLPRAGQVDVHVPPYRPRGFISVLAWLTARLGRLDAEATWHLERRQGPRSVRALLEGAGWQLDEHREGHTVRLVGRPPAKVPLPASATFETVLGSHPVTFAADHGVFSPEHVDEGTALLLDVALRHPPVDVVADIGVGYGPLAIGLVVNGVARESAGTDVDCVALWLAERNAEANGVPLSLRCSPDPEGLRPTPLTVSNIPTHINAKETDLFMTGLARRAKYGTVLAVVHVSLEERYVRHLTSRGLRVGRYPGASHVVLEATRPGR